MKKNTILLLLVMLNITILNAKEYNDTNIKIFCTDSIDKKLSIQINSHKLNLTRDAVQDNVGGYVDIPEDRYYLKTNSKVYYLDGVVKKDYEKNVNQFTAIINNNSNKFITIEEFYTLKNHKNLKLIQKIILENNNSKYKTTTNKLNIIFNKNLLSKEYKKCK